MDDNTTPERRFDPPQRTAPGFDLDDLIFREEPWLVSDR